MVIKDIIEAKKKRLRIPTFREFLKKRLGTDRWLVFYSVVFGFQLGLAFLSPYLFFLAIFGLLVLVFCNWADYKYFEHKMIMRGYKK